MKDIADSLAQAGKKSISLENLLQYKVKDAFIQAIKTKT